MEELVKKLRFNSEKPIDVPPDEPFINDRLKFNLAVSHISTLFDKIEPPFTLGIYGEWGSGKTSFMRMLEADLLKKKYKTFWFDTWQYENEGSLILPLLAKMSKQFRKFKKTIDRVKKSAWALSIIGANVLMKNATLGQVDLRDVMDGYNIAEDNTGEIYDKFVSETDALKDSFKGLVEKITAKDSKPLVIFIDDIDRCMPENMVRLLESIRHYLLVPNCIFVIGVDKAILEKGIQARYGSQLISGSDYLEKIIHLSFEIPSTGNSDSLIRNFFLMHSDIDPSGSDGGVFFAQIFINTISTAGFTNPRKIRALSLRYLMFLSLKDARHNYIPEIIIHLLIYRTFFPDAYKIIKGKKSILYFPEVTEKNPQNGKEIPLGDDAIKEVSCEDFVRINRDYQSFVKSQNEISIVINDTFVIADKKQALVRLKSRGPEFKQRDHYVKYIESDCSRDQSDYFRLVDLLFSLY